MRTATRLPSRDAARPIARSSSWAARTTASVVAATAASEPRGGAAYARRCPCRWPEIGEEGDGAEEHEEDGELGTEADLPHPRSIHPGKPEDEAKRPRLDEHGSTVAGLDDRTERREGKATTCVSTLRREGSRSRGAAIAAPPSSSTPARKRNRSATDEREGPPPPADSVGTGFGTPVPTANARTPWTKCPSSETTRQRTVYTPRFSAGPSGIRSARLFPASRRAEPASTELPSVVEQQPDVCGRLRQYRTVRRLRAYEPRVRRGHGRKGQPEQSDEQDELGQDSTRGMRRTRLSAMRRGASFAVNQRTDKGHRATVRVSGDRGSSVLLRVQPARQLPPRHERWGRRFRQRRAGKPPMRSA